MVTAFALFLIVSLITGVIFIARKGGKDAQKAEDAEDDVEAITRMNKEAQDAQKTRDAISRDYAAGKPRRMQGKYDID